MQQTAQRKIEYRRTPAPPKRIVKMEGNVAYVNNGAPKKPKAIWGDNTRPPKSRVIRDENKVSPKSRVVRSENKGLAKQKVKLSAAVQKEAKRTRAGVVTTIFVIFIAFCALAFLISRYATVSSIGSGNNKILSSIKAVETKIGELKSDMEFNDNLENIQSVAENKLGMKYPDQSQKVHLDMS